MQDWSHFDAGRTSRVRYRHPSDLVLPPPPSEEIAPHEVVTETGCLANVGLRIYESGNYTQIGVSICGSSGCPLGTCGLSNGTVTSLHSEHRTQEENIVSNWLMTEATERGTHVNDIYRTTVFRRWGMVNPSGDDFETIQAVNYTQAEPSEYGDGYIIRDCQLSEVVGFGRERHFSKGHSFPCSIICTFGPNVNYSTNWRSTSFQRRTYNSTMSSYERFVQAVTFSYFTALGTMATAGCDVAILGPISCGMNAGPHRIRIHNDLPAIIHDLLHGSYGVVFGLYFKRTALVLSPS